MKNKTKWVIWNFFLIDYKAMGEYLEKMAGKGWMLEKVGRSMAKFRAMEPQKLKFYVDVFKEGPLTPEKTEESEEYRKLCQESGWIFITSQDYLQFFYAYEDDEPVPIQTDEEIEQKMVELTLWKGVLRDIFILTLIAIFAFRSLFPVSDINFISFTGFTGTILFPALYILAAIPSAYGIIRIIKARRNIKRGLPIEKSTLKSARRRVMTASIPLWLIILFYILSFIGDALFKPNVVGAALLAPGIGFAIGGGIRYCIKKSKGRNKNGEIALYIVVIILVIIFVPMVTSSIREISKDMDSIDSIPEGYPVVTMEDILGKSEQGNLLNIKFDISMSPITPKYYNYWEEREISGVNKYMEIKYYKTINSYFAEIIFNGITNRLENGIKWRGRAILKKTVIIDDDMKNFWNADNMALTEEQNEIIIQKGNVVLHLSGDINFNDSQTRELMIEKFFSDL